jgi:uncharacterized protein
VSALADRIRGIVAPRQPAGDVAPAARPEAPNRSDAGAAMRRLEEVLAGTWKDNCFIIERRCDATIRHGREPIGSIASRLEESSAAAALFAPSAQAPFLFFDLETTGLNGGAGTHVFLVGYGRFDGDGGFATTQFLLTRPDGERALLGGIASDLESAGAIVSFNGKSFDAPLLETRYLFHRMPWTVADVPHVDVLHPARRFWGTDCRSHRPDGTGASDCSLVTLERRLIGGSRLGDVPGIEIPRRYFEFLRTGDARPLESVLAHNRLDLLTLAALTSRLLHLARVGPDAVRTASEALALGRVYARAEDETRARAAFTKAIQLSRAPGGAFDAVRVDALRALALAWRRVREYEEAAACWRQLIETRGCPAAIAREANEALAIHHEHRVRDLEAARAFALQSLDFEPQPAWTRAVQHRVARIERKLTVQPQLASWLSSRS